MIKLSNGEQRIFPMKKIAWIAAMVLAAGFALAYHVLADTVYQPSALFDTQLATAIANNTSTTSFTLQNGKDGDGNLLTGNPCFTVDGGLSNVEYICGSVSGTVVSNLVRGVSFTDGVTSISTHLQSHRIGADVKITDFPYLSQFARILNGVGTLPNYLNYASSIPIVSAPTSSYALPNWGQVTSYVTSVATSGAPDASQSSKGLVQIATPAQIASGTATSTDGAQTLWNVVSAGQYGKTYGATPTVVTNAYGSATGTASTTYTFSYTGASTTWVIPTLGSFIGGHAVSSSVSAVVTAYGAQGGATPDNIQAGGHGGEIVGTMPSSTLALGTTYYVAVGGAGGNNGSAGFNGGGSGGTYPGTGGGGGMTYLSTSASFSISASTQFVAGGGGGSSYYYNSGAHYGAGGYGGGTSGSAGASNGAGGGGGAGTQAGGGTGGTGNVGGASGTAGQGGNAPAGLTGTQNFYAAGGGGGFYGGGSGGGDLSGTVDGVGAGGGGSSFVTSNLTATSTVTNTVTGNGSLIVVYTFNYNDPTESVSSTVSGNNFGGTVTVSATTTHLSPTTSTINFAPWNFPVSGVSCMANTWASSLAPFILAENTTSVEFGFGSTIAGNKYDYQCNAY